jgi:D-aminoacyl-tRNA deacylase
VRAILQRVSRAEVRVAGDRIGEIGPGLVVFLGVGREDGLAIAERLADRVAELRLFRDEAGRTNLSLREIDGAVLVVSQFTLFADTRRGRRPGFGSAAPPEHAEGCYQRFVDVLRRSGLTVQTGRFGAEMEVELTNDGPFTIWLDTAESRPGGGVTDAG